MDLKSEREKKNISLAQIAADTHISLRYLQDIEESRFSNLPGGIYNRAFIKAYCESLNLDPKEILEQYEAQVHPTLSEKRTKTKITQIPKQNTFSVSGPILIWAFMLLISAVGIFFSRGWISDVLTPYFSDKSVSGERYEKSAEPSFGSTAASAVASEGSSQESNIPDAPADIATVPAETVDASQEIDSLPPKDSVSKASEAPPKLRLEIAAKDPCWISIEVDGIPSTKRIMEPGEKQEFIATDSLHLIIGNAGGIQIKINDKPAKPLGNTGEVVKLNIDLENLQKFIDQPTG